MDLLSYVDYNKEERVKIQSFLRGLPLSYRDMIEFSYPHTPEETIRMSTHFYEQNKGKVKVQPSWKGKSRKGFEPKKRELAHSYAKEYSEKGQQN